MLLATARTASSLVISFVLSAIFSAPLFAQPSGDWYASEWQLWCIDVDGANLRPLDTTPGCRAGSPVWSPDGTRIAYDVSRTDSTAGQIAVINADGSDRRVLLAGAIPTWSPDSRLIAFQDRGLKVVNADGTGSECLNDFAHGLRWSPRGEFIASIGGSPLMLFDPVKGTQTMLQMPVGQVSHGYGISPDGRRFAFGTHGNGLWLETIDDRLQPTKSAQLVDSGTVYHTSWSPDGKRIVFAWQPEPTALTQLYTIDVDSNEPPKPLPGLDTSHANVNPSWSPDGKSIVFSRPGKPKLRGSPRRASDKDVLDLYGR